MACASSLTTILLRGLQTKHRCDRSTLDAVLLWGIVIGADKRIDQLPNVPTLIEAGLAKERVANRFGLAAPAGTPTAVVQQLNTEFLKASPDQEVMKKIDASGAQVATSTPDVMARLVVEEVSSMTALVTALGLRKE